MKILPARPEHLNQWAQLRIKLWDWDTIADHRQEADDLYFSGKHPRAAFVAINEHAQIVGFAEAALRRDYVESCETSPVVFLEGIYVEPGARKNGVARALSEAVAAWGKGQGCTEYASNALLDNVDSHNFHAAIGFDETERVVYFKREL
jgi:aminoglycoside 6'-N-acetyltransferase I